MADRTDYWSGTSATWRALPLSWVRGLLRARRAEIGSPVTLGNHVYRLDHKSASSWYWVSEDGTHLVRLSDHWSSGSSSVNCGRIKDCRWRLEGDCGAVRCGLSSYRGSPRPADFTAGIVELRSMARCR